MTAQTRWISASPRNCRRDLQQWRTRALVVGIAGARAQRHRLLRRRSQPVLPLVPVVVHLHRRHLTLGPLAWLMLQYVTGGAWGVVIRRACEAAARTLPLVALMFLPDRDRHPQSLSVVARERRQRRSAAPAQSAVSERAVLPGPRRDLLRRLDVPLLVLQPLVGHGRSRGPRRGARQDEPHWPARACSSGASASPSCRSTG